MARAPSYTRSDSDAADENDRFPQWIEDNLAQVVTSVEAYKQHLSGRIQTVQISLGERSTATLSTVPFGVVEETIIRSIRRREHQLVFLENDFSLALENGI